MLQTTCPGCGDAIVGVPPALCAACRAAGAPESPIEPPLTRTPEPRRARGRRLYHYALLALFIAIFGAGIFFSFVRFKSLGSHVPFNDGHGKVYYKGGVTAEQAKAAADSLTREQVFGENTRVDIQLLRVGDRYELRLIVMNGRPTDPKTIQFSEAVAMVLSREVFGGAPCEAVYCDANFEPLK